MSYEGMTLYLMRHGETYLNLYHRMQGWSNAPLTDEGEIGVQESGRGLADIEFDAVYTSDLHRTIETANIILNENDHADHLTVQTIPEFREVFFGIFEGLDIDESYVKVAEAMGYDDVDKFIQENTIPERMNSFKKADPYGHAEDFIEFWSRIEQGLLKVVNKHKYSGDQVLVVVHGLVIRYMMQGLVADFDEIDNILNASVTRVRYEKGQFHIDAYNDTTHFLEVQKEHEDEEEVE